MQGIETKANAIMESYRTNCFEAIASYNEPGWQLGLGWVSLGRVFPFRDIRNGPAGPDALGPLDPSTFAASAAGRAADLRRGAQEGQTASPSAHGGNGRLATPSENRRRHRSRPIGGHSSY